MPNIGRMRKKYVKDQFQKMSEGNLVSDAESQGFKNKIQETAEQGLGAQQAALSRTQAALGTASPVAAGAITQGTQNLGQVAGDMAIKATGEGKMLEEAVREKRKAQAMEGGERLIAQNREDLAMGIETAARVGEAAGQIAMMAGGGA